MKAFVFKPSNELIGSFHVNSADQLGQELQKFAAQRPSLPDYSYVETGDRTWTIVCRAPLQIQEGRVHRSTQSERPTSVTPDARPSGSLDVYEYRILSQRDQLFSGRFDTESIGEVLNQLGTEGWRLISVTSAGVNTLLGGNRDEIVIFLERKKILK